MSETNYPTNLTDKQWQYIKKALNIQERKRKHDLRQIWDAHILFGKTGCQWRMLPNDFPEWQLVYYCYRKWSALDEFDLLLITGEKS